MPKAKVARLVLKDGTVFEGTGFGANLVRTGEAVFNTSITGYQEILTDPSYAGQIVVMTYPQIGNYGINREDVEAEKIYASGFVIRELSPIVSNYRSKLTLDQYLKDNKVPAIANIDTRQLVRHLRDHGAQPAVLAVGDKFTAKQLIKMAKDLPAMVGQNLAQTVTCAKPYTFSESISELNFGGADFKPQKPKYNVIAYDFGVKRNILRLLNYHGCRVKVVPYDYDADLILKSKDKIDGVFLSNGPGDPEPCKEAIQNVRKLLGKKPIFGICLGHQILSLALGAETYKLKFGHHGGNQPVKNLQTGHVEITAQNHGFAVRPESLPRDVDVTHIHLNDQTISGIRHKSLPAFSVQYHPEAAPGPHESRYLFEQFIHMMEK